MENRNEDIHSPFKFLDPFNREDGDIFFGREEEQEELYANVKKNRIVLLYGLSGTGKTSIVQCGLTNRFDPTDWIPFFIRRSQNINSSLANTLLQSRICQAVLEEEKISISRQQYNPPPTFVNISALPQKLLKALRDSIVACDNKLTDTGVEVEIQQVLDEIEDTVQNIRRINVRALRPVYLIFDQFEELLIEGKEKERINFVITLHVLLSTETAIGCNLLFMLREEYFAWLDRFEYFLPGFANRRQRIEPMRPVKIAEVITRSCDKFSIKLENPAENAGQIIELLSGKSGVSLPYLQIYLDQLWRDDYKRTYPGIPLVAAYPALEFTSKEIADFGGIQDVLERFLSERRTSIQDELEKTYPAVPADLTRNVLDAFVTDEGTKLPLAYKNEQDKIRIIGRVPPFLDQLSATPQGMSMLSSCLAILEKNRILRSDGNSFELAHDVLADLIDRQRSATQRRLNEIRKAIKNRHDEFQMSNEYLSAKQIAMYEDFIVELNLDDYLQKFFDDSKIFRENQSYEEIKKANLQAAKERSLKEEAQKKSRQARTRSWLAFFTMIVSLLFLIFIISQNKRLAERNDEIEKSKGVISQQRENLQEVVDNKTRLEMDKLRSDVSTFTKAGYNDMAYRRVKDKRDTLEASYSKFSTNPDSLFKPFKKELDSLLLTLKP